MRDRGWRCNACFEFPCLFKMCARACFRIFRVVSLFTSRFSSLARVLPQGYHRKSARVTRGRAGRGLLPSTRGVACCFCGRL